MSEPNTHSDPRIAWCTRAAIGLLVVLYGLTYKQWIGAYSMAGLLLLTLIPISIELDRIGQVIVALVCLVGAYTFAVGIGPAPPHPFSQVISLLQAFLCVWALMYASLRLRFKNPILGHKGTILLIMLGVFVAGGSRGRLNYHAFVLVFVVLGLFVVYLDDPTRPSFGVATGKRKGLLLVAVVAASLTMGSLWVSLPIAYKWVSQKLGLMLFPRHQTGFDMFFKVGSLKNVIKSKRVVLRVKGPYRSGIHLRGLVYNRYRGRSWLLPPYSSAKLQSIDTLPGKIKPHFVSIFVDGDGSRYFAPIGSSRFATPSGRMKTNAVGVLMPLEKDKPEPFGFSLGPNKAVNISPPKRQELLISSKLRKPLRMLALKWTQGIPHQHVAARLAALRNRLQKEYKYSLSFTRPTKGDPIIDFLYKNKQGHCEYFASALALLARSLGISTRVAGGYLASEYSSMGGYYIVRDQNAHAWVEAWIPGKGWQTYDATPAGGLSTHMPQKSAFLAGLLDYLRVLSERLRHWLTSLSYTQLFVSIGSFLALWIGIRLIRHFRGGDTLETLESSAFREPLPAFEALMQALASILPKRDAETLEGYAERLRDAELPAKAHLAATLIMDYASFRYGEIGDQGEIVTKMNEWLTD